MNRIPAGPGSTHSFPTVGMAGAATRTSRRFLIFAACGTSSHGGMAPDLPRDSASRLAGLPQLRQLSNAERIINAP
jgi:hypothetical protein